MGHELSIAVIHGAGGTKKRDVAVGHLDHASLNPRAQYGHSRAQAARSGHKSAYLARFLLRSVLDTCHHEPSSGEWCITCNGLGKP